MNTFERTSDLLPDPFQDFCKRAPAPRQPVRPTSLDLNWQNHPALRNEMAVIDHQQLLNPSIKPKPKPRAKVKRTRKSK